MEAPKKIYVHIKDKPCEITFSEVIEKECSNIEYIRTDLIIERACEFIKDNGSRYIDIVDGQLVLKKGIIKDFKNHIKGE